MTSYQFGGDPSLTCKVCGRRATHAHFIPWVEEPERVVVACEDCEPADGDDDWFSLLELASNPRPFLKIARRSAAPPPTALMMWLKAQQPQQRPSVEGEEEPSSVEAEWSTVAQVANRHGLAEKTIRESIRRGDLEAHRSRGRGPYRVHRDAEAEWVSARKVPTSRPGRARRARKGQPGRRFRDMVSE